MLVFAVWLVSQALAKPFLRPTRAKLQNQNLDRRGWPNGTAKASQLAVNHSIV